MKTNFTNCPRNRRLPPEEVQLFNILSSRRQFQQGFSQDSVLAPLLFLSYINNLPNKLSKAEAIAMFADDVRILLTARKKFDTECHAQKEVDIVPQWSRQ